ncbi:MAG: family F420-dependent class oxidoreductase [Aeromicrobium sp.]|nr:family F420-dependent class oxidoreductase [Aeromicrobium sp.]
MRIDLRLDAAPVDAAKRAIELEGTGVDGLFTFEGAHDVFLPLALAAYATGLPIMSNIAVALPRSPLHLAHIAHDLQALSGGNFVLGLGSQVKTHIERRYGSTWSAPAKRMRETVAATREILLAWHEGRQPDFHGEFTRHDFMPPTFAPPALPWGPPPVMMGALGPLMTRTAGEVSDGLLVMPFNTARHIQERTLPALREGIELSGRTEADVPLVPEVITAVGRTDTEIAAAKSAARALVAFYASTPAYRPVLEVEGLEDLQPQLQDLVRAGDREAMAAAIPDELLAAVAVIGTPEECAQQMADRFADLTDRVCVYFPHSSPSLEVIRDLVQAVQSSDVTLSGA